MRTPSIEKKALFLSYIHDFRGIAILLIVSSHILMEDMDNTFYRIMSAIFLNSTIFFVFVSGFLFQHLAFKYDVKTYWKRKIKGIVIPYILISIPAILLRIKDTPAYIIENHPEYASWGIFHKVAYMYLTGSHLLPFWFIPMIILFFAISPLLVYLDKTKWIYWLLPVFMIISAFYSRDDITQINDTFRMFAHFFSVYLLGMFYSRYKDEIASLMDKIWPMAYLIGGVLLVITCFEIPYVTEVIFFQKIVLCFVCVHLLKRYEGKMPQFLDFLAKISFGIYFVHYYIVIILRKVFLMFFTYEKPTNPIMWFLNYILVVILTIIIIQIIRYITKDKSKYLIGC